MTRTEAFVYAAKKMIERQRNYIDEFDVKSLSITIKLDKEGNAACYVEQRSEDMVVGCLEGPARVDRFKFST